MLLIDGQKKIRSVTVLDLIKCLKQIKYIRLPLFSNDNKFALPCNTTEGKENKEKHS